MFASTNPDGCRFTQICNLAGHSHLVCLGECSIGGNKFRSNTRFGCIADSDSQGALNGLGGIRVSRACLRAPRQALLHTTTPRLTNRLAGVASWA
eukprot:353299-Chlamydomonas_euryale.AAC.12